MITNGNISEYVTTNGEIVAHYDYSPFGETLMQTGDLASAFTHRFSTKPWCPVTGLCEYQMRKYRPEIGRWLNRDPIEEDNSISLYCFVLNNSDDDIDYLGLSIWDWKAWPWNWFTVCDKCHSEFSFKDLGWKYADTMHTIVFEYNQSYLSPSGIMSWTAKIKAHHGHEFGITISDYEAIGYSCCCDKSGKYFPRYFFSLFTESYILNHDAREWQDDNRRFRDPRVAEYWRHSSKFWRRHMVRRHESRHRNHAKSNYKEVVGILREFGKESYDTKDECLSAAQDDINIAIKLFREYEKYASEQVERGEL